MVNKSDIEDPPALADLLRGTPYLIPEDLLLDGILNPRSPSGSVMDRASALWNAAITAVERGRPADGLLLSEQAGELVRLSGNLQARARIQVTQAWVLLAQTPPQPERARDHLRNALPQLRQYANMLSVCSAQTELARCEVLMGRPSVAVRLARTALSTCHRTTRWNAPGHWPCWPLPCWLREIPKPASSAWTRRRPCLTSRAPTATPGRSGDSSVMSTDNSRTSTGHSPPQIGHLKCS